VRYCLDARNEEFMKNACTASQTVRQSWRGRLKRFAQRLIKTSCEVGGIFFIFAPQFGFAGPMEDLRAYTKELKSLQGDFTQVSLDGQAKPGKTLSGKFSLAQGGKFRFDYQKPYQQVLVSDGVTFSTYDADLAQMTIRKLDDSLAATPLSVLSGQASIDALFTLKLLPTEDGIAWIAASAKQADAAVSDLRFGLAGAELRALSWIDNLGKRTVMTFSGLKRNSAIEAARFAFVPPAGTDVVGAK
jgi:outer membrane lipoprotein carrier protein